MDTQTIESLDKKLCTGCKMCGDSCPTGAINFSTNSEGFWYPRIDSEKCINCGKCFKLCPISDSANEKEKLKVYAGWINDDEIRRESTSGGIYYALADYVLQKNGYLIGSIYSEDFKSAYHIASDKREDLSRIMGSKYFQSDTKGIYDKAKSILEEGKLLLFTGSPCQITALRKYLGKEYDNLITVDFICRGIPSPLLQKKKIELYEKENNSKVIFYRDKSKKKSWAHFGELIRFENGKEKFISRYEDDINECFISKNYNMRESCYYCKYKKGNNFSDITIGDFWGIKGITSKDSIYGVSAIIVNTEKGDAVLDSLGNNICKSRRPQNEMIDGNPAYIKSQIRPKERDDFFATVVGSGLREALEKFNKKGIKHRLYTKIKNLIRHNEKFKFLIKNIFNINWLSFISCNYLNKSVERNNNSLIIPFWGAQVKISREAKLIIDDDVLINNYGYPRGNRNSFFIINKNARVHLYNKAEIAYDNTFSVASNAELIAGHFFTGVGANIICKHKMTIGNNVMFGRDVCVFDSDYHDIYDSESNKINPDKEVIIGDNVWIGARSMVLKGSIIHDGAIVGANSSVAGIVEGKKVFINKKESKSVGKEVFWKR